MTQIEWSETPKSPLEIDGVALEYACWGPSPDAAPTLVMLHEGLGSVAQWRDFPQVLAQATGMGVFAYSRQGYGQSDLVDLPRPLDFMTREAGTLGRVLDTIGFQRGILFGHSDGATIAAIHTGGTEDHRVRGLILMAPHFFAEPAGLDGIRAARVAYETGDLKAKLARHHRDVDTAFYGWNDTWLNPEFATWNVAETIDYFRVPVLAIQGHDDAYGTLDQITVIEERSYAPVDLCLLDDCGHSPHREHPDQTREAICDFAARLWRIEAAEVETA